MEHVALLANLLAVLAAVGAIGSVISTYQRVPQRFLAHFIGFLCLVFVGGMAEIARNYLSTNLGMSGAIFSVTSTLAIAVPTLLGLLHLIRFGEEILEISLRLIMSLFLALATLQILASLAVSTDLAADVLGDNLVIALQVMLFLLYQGLAAKLIWNHWVGRLSRGFAIRLAGVWIASKTFVEVLLVGLHMAANLSYQWVVTLQGVVEIGSAVLVISFVRPFTRMIIAGTLAEKTDHLANVSFLDEYRISPRERQVLELVISGFANREIANQLHISVVTVKDHVYSIYNKTGVRNRVQLTNLFRK